MVVIQNRLIPFGRYRAINLFGIVFAKGRLSPPELRHEYIHTLQQRELLFVGFYLWYVVEWLIRLAVCRNLYRSYRFISFEQEAYSHMADPDYLSKRRHFVWFRQLVEN